MTNTPQRSPEHEVYKKWVLGFVSGANVYQSLGADFLRNTDSDAIAAWIDNYCRQNPLHGITQAVNELIDVLQRRGETPLTPLPIPPPRPR
jgi:hypothetical protein